MGQAILSAFMNNRRSIFVTGTDTGVGKTVVAALLTRCLRKRGVDVVALKPICSGGREDARILRAAAGDRLTLDDVNPWHFKAALSPTLAAREEGKSVRLVQAYVHAKHMRKRYAVTIFEGAGGLLSPMGADFNSRDLLWVTRGTPVVVCPNRLGAVNQLQLTLRALPQSAKSRAHSVLVDPRRPDAASRTNRDLLLDYVAPNRLHVLPWLNDPESANAVDQAEIALRKLLDLFT